VVRRAKFLQAFRVACWLIALPSAVVLVTAIALRCVGRLIPYRIPTNAMQPTIRQGDQVFMEGLSYLWRPPARGDLVVFRTRDIPAVGRDEVYVKRLAGLPGEHMRIRDGQLIVNDRAVPLLDANRQPIQYVNAGMLAQPTDELVVPADQFFVLGDNSRNSADSRYWGFVPKQSVQGRVWLRYWPWR
jgi:signal peptidase I